MKRFLLNEGYSIIHCYKVYVYAVLHKAGQVVSHCWGSTLATEKVEELLDKTVIAKNETCWNSQLKVVRQLVEIDVDKVVDKREFQLN